jgi:hypothetical protein
VALVMSTEVSLPAGSRTVNESPERTLTMPWTFLFSPCGTGTSRALLAFCAKEANAVISAITNARPTSTAIDFVFLIFVSS